MTKIKYICIVCVIFTLLGCATLPLPAPVDSQSACIGISAKYWQILGDKSVDQVFFIKLEEEEGLYSHQGYIIRSNYSKDGQIYLLNAKPGRYAAVGSYHEIYYPMHYENYLIFSKELIKLTEITVAPGKIAFMGEYVVEASIGFDDADDAQKHYLSLISPGAKTGLGDMMWTLDGYYPSSLNKDNSDSQAEIEFLSKAKNHFKDTDWTILIHKRTEELKKGIQMSTDDIGKDIEQSAKTTDQPREKQKLTSTPETAPTIKVTDQPKEKPKVAAIPKEVPIRRVSLRKKSLEITVIKITDMLLEYDFFERSRNTRGSFVNGFVDNNDSTVTDKATGLMWQKSGSSSSLENKGAKEYIKQLNRKRFAGHSDWRMPTLEELASLLEKSRKSGVHINPVFDNKQTQCWCSDKRSESDSWHYGGWIVSFSHGSIMPAKLAVDRIHAGWRRQFNYKNYLRAVRSVK